MVDDGKRSSYPEIGNERSCKRPMISFFLRWNLLFNRNEYSRFTKKTYLVLLHLLLKLLLLHETNISLSLLHGLRIAHVAAAAVAAMTGIVGIGVGMVEIRYSNRRIGDRVRIADRRVTGRRHLWMDKKNCHELLNFQQIGLAPKH